MFRERAISPLTADDNRLVAGIERDLERLLAIEPSAGFVQRVRTRIADGEVVRERVSWTYWAAAAAIALVAVGALLTTGRPPAPAPRPVAITAPKEATAPAADPGVPRAPGGVGGIDVPAPPRIRPAPAPVVLRAEPEVIVPGDRKEALGRLLAMAEAGTLDERVFPSEPRPGADGESEVAVGPILVEELEVAPLIDDDDGGLEGAWGAGRKD
jgi:hypothetical protein